MVCWKRWDFYLIEKFLDIFPLPVFRKIVEYGIINLM